MSEHNAAKYIILHTFEVALNNGVKYHVECGYAEIDALLDLIGESNILYCEEV